MEQDSQAVLLEIPEQAAVEQGVERGGRAKLKTIQRDQTMLVQIWLEELIGADHKARAIWELTGRLDLSRFEEPLKTRVGAVGRAVRQVLVAPNQQPLRRQVQVAVKLIF